MLAGRSKVMDMDYEVWMGFKNYLGEVYEVTEIAKFKSRTRAEQYIEFCKSDRDDTVIYAIRER